MGSLTAGVKGSICTTVNLRGASNTDSEGNKVFVIGTPDQPASCREPKGDILLYDERGRRLATTLPISPGATHLLQNLAPMPPHSPEYGFLRVTVTVGDKRIVGVPDPAGAPFLLVLPLTLAEVQPVSVGSLVPYLRRFESDGEVAVVVEEGDYLIGWSNVEFRLEEASVILRIQGGQPLPAPVLPIHIAAGESIRLDLTAVYDPIAPIGPPITPPIVGDAGLR